MGRNRRKPSLLYLRVLTTVLTIRSRPPFLTVEAERVDSFPGSKSRISIGTIRVHKGRTSPETESPTDLLSPFEADGLGRDRASHRILTGATVPDPPTNVVGESPPIMVREALVSWTAPANNNSTITEYQVNYARSDNTSFTGTASVSGNPPPTSLTVANLTTGAGYKFSVRAINAVGTGLASAESSEVIIIPGKILNSSFSHSDLMAGQNSTVTLNITCLHALPADGHIFLELPVNLTLLSLEVLPVLNIDGDLTATKSGQTVIVSRSGATEVSAGVPVSLAFAAVRNPPYEGVGAGLATIKTLESDGVTSIDEVSADFHSEYLPSGSMFIPGAFMAAPVISLQSYAAGAMGEANLTFVTSNPIPAEGNIVVTFPANFSNVNITEAVPLAGLTGGLHTYMESDGYTVIISRNGATTPVPTGTKVSVSLTNVTNQVFEGMSGAFPVVKTTLANTAVAIDEASMEFNSGTQAAGVLFTPSGFPVRPMISLATYAAGVEGSANLTFTTSNPVPAAGKVVVTFPSNFSAVNASEVRGLSGLDGGLGVEIDGFTVTVSRDGMGTTAPAGTVISIGFLNGIVNQHFEGRSENFPLVKTTLANPSIAIDEASADFNRGDQAPGVLFTPSNFAVKPLVSLATRVAGMTGAANITFTTSNPVPADGNIIVTFPRNFSNVNVSTASPFAGLDGGLAVTIGSDGYTVILARDGSGSATPSGVKVVIILNNGITNQRFEGWSSFFPLVKTALSNLSVGIDEASTEINMEDQPPGVLFIPGAFVDGPVVMLDNYAAGMEGGALLNLTTLNPIPINGQVIVTFPGNFSDITTTAASSVAGLDGGLSVSIGSDGYTVGLQRDGSGSETPGGTLVSIRLQDGVTNQFYEGWSTVFPLVRTTLANHSVAIDEASAEFNSLDRVPGVLFTPGAFGVKPNVTLASSIAGYEGAADLTFTTSNPVPADGKIYLTFPSNFTGISVNSTIALQGLDGDLTVAIENDSMTVRVARDGTGSSVPAGTSVSIRLNDGIINQQYEGWSSAFPLVKTTLANDVAIDEASTEFNKNDRAMPVLFTPASFAVAPILTLASYTAGIQGSANLTFVTSNPIPADGSVTITFPGNFSDVNVTEANALAGLDGGVSVVMGVDGYTVTVRRDGTGTPAPAGTTIYLGLNGVTNQRFEGRSAAFPLVKTTLADNNVAIDEASEDFNSGDQVPGVLFTPAGFTTRPSLSLASYAAGVEGSANLSFTPSNPIPVGGSILVTFPSNFTSVNVSTAVPITGLDGGLGVLMDSDEITVIMVRDAMGTVVPAGTEVSISLVDGIQNQLFEGWSTVFPMVRTTLANQSIAIDEVSAEINGGDRAPAVLFTPARFAAKPTLSLSSYSAGAKGAVNLTFTTSNPIPTDGKIVVEFPVNFSNVNISTIAVRSGLDGGIDVAMGVDGYTVTITRDGSGSVVPGGTVTSVSMNGVTNQLFEGDSVPFPSIQTTLGNGLAIDEASREFHRDDMIPAVLFTPGRFSSRPVVRLASYVAGVEGAANLTFATTNPVPADGKIFVTFPSNFNSINVSTATPLAGLDGGLSVSVSGHTVIVALDGTGNGVAGGELVSVRLNSGVANQRFGGLSSVFPAVRTTLATTAVTIDEASQDFNAEDRPPAVLFIPGVFLNGPSVTLFNSAAGEEDGAYLNFTTSNPIPTDGLVIVTFPKNFSNINVTRALGAAGLDGGLDAETSNYVVKVKRDGTGSEIAVGTAVSILFQNGITNQLYEGWSARFPSVKSTFANESVPIDEASEDYNTDDQASGVLFTPSSFTVKPTISLASYAAGAEGEANLTFVTSNPLPADGRIVVTFPRNFSNVNVSSATAVNGLDGELNAKTDKDGYTVVVARDGTGSVINSGTAVSVILRNVTNQLHEGWSLGFPVVKTTLSNTTVAIDEASSDFNSGDQASGVLFTPAAFAAQPVFTLTSYMAGFEGAANVTFTTTNPLPADGQVIVTFPRNFSNINVNSGTVQLGLDGGLTVSTGDDGYTVTVGRDGSGTTAPAGTEVSICLHGGITNQLFEGLSTVFPVIKTTLAGGQVAIDEASAEYNSNDQAVGILFTPAKFAVAPTVTLTSYRAGEEVEATLNFTTSNPVPEDGNILIAFPGNFHQVNVSEATAHTGLDGGLGVYTDTDSFSVRLARDGTGSVTPAGSEVTISLKKRIVNQQFEGWSMNFPFVKTTLGDTSLAIDETSVDFHTQDQPSGVLFTPGAFAAGPTVTLGASAAGAEDGVYLNFTTSNPIPSNGHVFLGFPSNFIAVNATRAIGVSGIDGGFNVESDNGRTIKLERDSTGSATTVGTSVSIRILDGVTNQLYEGWSSSFPLVKTTLANISIAIEEASTEFNTDSLATPVLFTPGAFTETPSIDLDTYIAGEEGGAHVNFTTGNPTPNDGHIVITFPRNFSQVSVGNATLLAGMDGELSVFKGEGDFTVILQRDGNGTETPAGTNVLLRLEHGLTNQLYEGYSAVFPAFKTTRANLSVAIDEASTEHDSVIGPLRGVYFMAGPLLNMRSELKYRVAGMETAATFTFTLSNPLPADGLFVIDFPTTFSEATPSAASFSIDGNLAVNGSSSIFLQRGDGASEVSAGETVVVTLDSVFNPESTGDTGNFTLTTFTGPGMAHRIDTGVAPSVSVDKQIVSASGLHGSSNVAVAEQEKWWTFEGLGLQIGDEVKWANSSATLDEHCDWGVEERSVNFSANSTTTSLPMTFSNSSEDTGPLQLCYRFSDGSNPYKLYPDIWVDVYEVYAMPSSDEGSAAVSVVDYPKVVTFTGFGVSESDRVRWILQGENCTTEANIAPLAEGGEGGNNTSVLNSSHKGSFTFSEDVFTLAKNTGPRGANVSLCFRFGSERFQHYSSITMDIRHVSGWGSSVGSADMAVVGVAEELGFTGFGMSSSDRASWIKSGTDCSANRAAIEESESGKLNVSSSGRVIFTFEESESGHSPYLCYWFEDEPAMVYPSLTIDVAFMSFLGAPSFGDNDVAVVDYPKPWGFGGGHIQDGDYVRWIYNESSNCTDQNSLVDTAEDGQVKSGETTSTFSEAISGRWITPCYRHGSEPWRLYSKPVFVKMLHNITAVWGNDTAAVAEQPKQWLFRGDGLFSGTDTDLIKFVVNTTSCDTDAPGNDGYDAELNGADLDGISMYLDKNSNATFTFQPSVAGRNVSLCYKFDQEPYKWYDIKVYVHMLNTVGTLVGGTNIAVVDVQEVFAVDANGTSTTDYMRWISTTDTSDAACLLDDTIVWTKESPHARENVTDEIPVYRHSSGVFHANFTFNDSASGLSPTLCYKFGGERWKLYSGIKIDIAMLKGVEAGEGSSTVAVVHYSKPWSFTGEFLAAGDQVFWSAGSCGDGQVADLTEDSDNILELDSTLIGNFEFDTLASGFTVSICYRFNNEPFKLYAEFSIDLRMIRMVAAGQGSASKAVPDLYKTFSFVGDGTASEAGIDKVKWIRDSDCSSAGISGLVDGGDDQGGEFELLYFSSTGFTSQTLTFPASEVGGPYSLCYSFDKEPYKLYQDLQLSVVGITSISAVQGSADRIVVGAPKVLAFTGGGAVEAGDEVIWISDGKVDADCTVDVFRDGPSAIVTSLGQAEFLLPDGADGAASAGKMWTLCYRFGNEALKIYPSFTLSAIMLLSLSADKGSDDTSVVGYPKVYFAAGPGVESGDRVKWVSESVVTNDGCGASDSDNLAGGLEDASTVDYFMTTSSVSDPNTILSVSFTFTKATIGDGHLNLCYRHGDEPFKLHRAHTMKIRQLLTAEVRTLGTQQVLHAVVSSPQYVSFTAHGGKEGDRYKWVTPSGGPFLGTIADCADEADPAAGSSVGVAVGFYHEAIFVFSEAASDLMLCYGPGAEPFMAYPETTMSVVAPTITSTNRTHVIAGKSAAIQLVGTFGLTSGDALKLAENSAGDCTGDPAGGDGAVFTPFATTSGLSTKTGTSQVILLVSDRSDQDRPYQLCYRFGKEGPWELFDLVSWEAFEVATVSVDISEGLPAAGNPMEFTFEGTGVSNGDMAKWVSSTVAGDDECAAAEGVSGSSVSTIAGGKASFSFAEEVETWNLCYRYESQWCRYTGLTPTASGSTSSSETASETQIKQATVSMTLEGQLSSYPEGSSARTDLEEAFILDLAQALGEDVSRFEVTGIESGSIVITFTINPSGSIADTSVDQLLATLDEQMKEPSSPLRHGNVTSATKVMTYSTSLLSEQDSTANLEAGFSVLEYQPKGLFGFASSIFYTTEGSGTVKFTVSRDHGIKGVMDIGFTTTDGTAQSGTDYVGVDDTVRFYDGDTVQEFEVVLLDDDDEERHFEVFTVTLSLQGPINEGAALRVSSSTSTVRLYDYGDGDILAETSFSMSKGEDSAKASGLPEHNGSIDLAQGWQVVGNSGQQGWVDTMGFAASDVLVGNDEYDDRCDYAATTPCDHDCRFGGDFAEKFPQLGHSPSVLRLDGSGFVITRYPVTDFPSSEFSVSLWLRTFADSSDGGTILSYTVPGGSPWGYEVLLHNPQSLSLLVHDVYVPAEDRYDGPEGGDLQGLLTGVNVADGAWHHIAVAWRAADGRVNAYADGAKIFSGGPYKTGALLSAGGRLVLGQAQNDGIETCVAAASPSGTEADIAKFNCGFGSLDGMRDGPTGLKADVQNLRLWSKFFTADEVSQQMHTPFQGNSIGQILHWEFIPESITGGLVKDESGIGRSSGVGNEGVISSSGTSLFEASPSLNPGYPCGEVYSGIWRFSAPDEFVTGLQEDRAYGGRFQFRLTHTSADGDVRAARGAVSVKSKNGLELSWSSVFDTVDAGPGDWTYVSVILREDHGWTKEPLGDIVTATVMKEVLANASELLIRGDVRVFGSTGTGQEVVYVEDVRLFAVAS